MTSSKGGRRGCGHDDEACGQRRRRRWHGFFSRMPSFTMRRCSIRRQRLADRVGISSCRVRFLYFHAIELFLKAYLRQRGLKEAVLKYKPYGHHLNVLATEAATQGLRVTRRVQMICDGSAAFDDPFEARYLRTGAKFKFPPIACMRRHAIFRWPLSKLSKPTVFSFSRSKAAGRAPAAINPRTGYEAITTSRAREAQRDRSSAHD